MIMARSGDFKVVLVLAILCIAMVAPSAEGAVTCGQVVSNLSPCMAYLRSAGGVAPPACCSGVKAMNAAASTQGDRQIACRCLKSISGSVPGLNYGTAAALPSKCGVSIPYKISPSTDCNSVH